MKIKNKNFNYRFINNKIICLVVIFLFISISVMSYGNTGCACRLPGPAALHGYANINQELVTLRAAACQGSDASIERKGFLFRSPRAKATIILCHGFMCTKHDVRFLRQLFADYNVLMFDFRAHGECAAGQCCTFGNDEVCDVRAAVHFVRSDPKMKKLPLIAYAFSMGAVTVIHAQAQDPELFDGAILDCPFDCTDALLDRMIDDLKIPLFGYSFSLPGASFLKKYKYHGWVQSLLVTALKTVTQMDTSPVNMRMVPLDVVSLARKITVPVMLISCKRDKKAPPPAIKRLFYALNGPRQLYITEGRWHYDSYFYNPERYASLMRHFMDDFLSQRLARLSRDLIVEE